MSNLDREMLELAAKAAGIEGYRYSDGFRCMAHWNESDGGWFDACGLWDPLTDDGDALRLAVKLQLEIYIDHGGVAVRTHCGLKTLEDGCDSAATRRAIVRAAAAIGEPMQ